MKKLRADCSQGMLAIIRCRTFSLPVSYQKYKDYGIQNYYFALFCTGVKLGPSH